MQVVSAEGAASGARAPSQAGGLPAGLGSLCYCCPKVFAPPESGITMRNQVMVKNEAVNMEFRCLNMMSICKFVFNG